MGIFIKGEKKEKEPEFFMSATNIPTINYRVYYMKPIEKILFFALAFCVGAAAGYLFYGGIGKDEFGQPTQLTRTLNILIPSITGCISGILFLPMRVEQVIEKRKKELNIQFRDMLEAFTISLGSGKNVVDSFHAIYGDLEMQFDKEAYILKELQVVISGIQNNVAVEELLYDFGVRSANDDIKSFANVFKVSYRKGGNLKEIIRNTYEILNDKMEIREDIETIVTSNKTEQYIMVFMPFMIVGMMKSLSSDFANNFVTPAGIISTTIGIVFFAAAYYLGKKMLEIQI